MILHTKSGYCPITNHDIDEEENKLVLDNNLDRRKDRDSIRAIATKNAVTRFLKDNLGMNERDCVSLQITHVYHSKKEVTPIIYIQCQTTEDISLIISHVSNLPQSSDRNSPSIVTHIPQILFKIYQYCQKLMFKLRKSQPNVTIQTNIRLGRRDFLLRHRIKGDMTQWKDIPTLKIPREATIPELGLSKKTFTEMEDQGLELPIPPPRTPPKSNDQQSNTTNSPTDQFLKSNFSPTSKSNHPEDKSPIPLSETAGSVGMMLKGKHSLSLSSQYQVSKKNRNWEPMANTSQTFNQQADSNSLTNITKQLNNSC